MYKFLTLTLVSNTRLAGLEKVISAHRVFTEEQLKAFYEGIDEFFKETNLFTVATQERTGMSLSDLSDCTPYAYEFVYTKEKLLKSIEVVDISNKDVELLRRLGLMEISTDDILADLDTLFEV